MHTVKRLRVRGGKSLAGSLRIAPNKNAVLPVLCATMLTQETCILKGVPRSPDVLKIIQAIEKLGGTCEWKNHSVLKVNCSLLENRPVDLCVADIQSGILFVGPLLARFGIANVPQSIGCKLGYRGPEDHIDFLSSIGATSDFKNGRVIFNLDHRLIKSEQLVQGSQGATIRTCIFSVASVTATENLLMVLSRVTQYDVELRGGAQEPHVEYLSAVLRKMGVQIIGKENALVVKGSLAPLKGFECDFALEPDHVDFYGSAVTAVLTGSNLSLMCRPTLAIRSMVAFLERSGIRCNISDTYVTVFGAKGGYAPLQGFSKADDTTWKLNPGPWPGFPVDCVPSFIALAATNSMEGTSTFLNNWMYEDGLTYIDDMKDFGARIDKLSPQKVRIHGLEKRNNQFYWCESGHTHVSKGVPIIEGTRALFSMALARNGETIIEDVTPFLRRAPDFVENYKKLGARIELG